MGNSSSSNISHVYPTIERNTFFPGNLVRGTVTIGCKDEVEYTCLAINLVGQLSQSYLVENREGHGRNRRGRQGNPLAALTGDTSHMVRKTIDMNLGDVGCTIIGSSQNAKNTYRLAKGDHTYEWAFMLPPVLLPSAKVSRTSSGGFGERKSGDETAAIKYFITAEISVDGKSAKQGSIPIIVLFPIGVSMWNRPSAISKPFSMDLTACFCCARGKVSCNAGLAKTIVALDVDTIQYTVDIDGSQSEDPIANMKVSLIATVNVKQGQRPIRFMNVIFTDKKNCGVAAGQKKQINGVLQLGANRPPTIQSSVIDVSYEVVFEFDFEFAENTKASIPVYVAHSVDHTDAATQLQSMHQQVLSGRQEVPNLLNPLYQEYRPPSLQDSSLWQHPAPPQQQQPPMSPHHHHHHHHHHQQQQQQFAPMPHSPEGFQQHHHHHHHHQHQQQFQHQHHQHHHQQMQQMQPPSPHQQQQYQQPEQYNQSNFAGDQQFNQQQYQQFGGIAAFPNAQLSQQAQQA